MDELADMLKEVVINHSKKLKGVTIVMHDFGCVYGNTFQQKYPLLVKRIAAIDIG